MHNLSSAGGKKITHHFHHKYYSSADNQMHITRPQQEIKRLLNEHVFW